MFAPEFSSVPDVTVNQWITIAQAVANTGCLDAERAAMAQAWYAAHLLSLYAQTSTVSGAIVSEKEGDLQRTYAQIKGSDTNIGQTRYGQQYLDITKACFGSAIMTRGCS